MLLAGLVFLHSSFLNLPKIQKKKSSGSAFCYFFLAPHDESKRRASTFGNKERADHTSLLQEEVETFLGVSFSSFSRLLFAHLLSLMGMILSIALFT